VEGLSRREVGRPPLGQGTGGNRFVLHVSDRVRHLMCHDVSRFGYIQGLEADVRAAAGAHHHGRAEAVSASALMRDGRWVLFGRRSWVPFGRRLTHNCPRRFRSGAAKVTLQRGNRGGPGRTRTCNQTVMSGRL
jgi:hypothetical protein